MQTKNIKLSSQQREKLNLPRKTSSQQQEKRKPLNDLAATRLVQTILLSSFSTLNVVPNSFKISWVWTPHFGLAIQILHPSAIDTCTYNIVHWLWFFADRKIIHGFLNWCLFFIDDFQNGFYSITFPLFLVLFGA